MDLSDEERTRLTNAIRHACHKCRYPYEIQFELSSALARNGVPKSCTFIAEPYYEQERLRFSVALLDQHHDIFFKVQV